MTVASDNETSTQPQDALTGNNGDSFNDNDSFISCDDGNDKVGQQRDASDKEGQNELLLQSEDDDVKSDKNNNDNSDDSTIGNDDDDNELPNDSFSMLYVARTAKEHIMPICVFGLQVLILILILLNLLESSDRPLETPIHVPVDVTWTVKVSQYIACMVSVFTADDLVEGALHVGRQVVRKDHIAESRDSSDWWQSISEANKKRWKWELANSLRIIEGGLVVVVSFIFIVQSDTAIDLWLNFAAVQFVGMLDDTAYHLSKNRFLGTTARRLANRVDEYEVYAEGGDHKRRVWIRRMRLALFGGIGLTMWAGLTYFVYNQAQQTYPCSVVTLTVGENRLHHTRHISGRYTIQNEKINKRAVYVQEQGRGNFLAYCSEVNFWTVSPLNAGEAPQDPCSDFILQSQRTKTHDVTELIGDGLVFWTGEDAEADIKCSQCDASRPGSCSYQGTCNSETKFCDCEEGYFGDSCQFDGPCTEMVMHEEFHGYGEISYDRSFDLMYLLDGQPVMVYERPVYVQETSNNVLLVVAFDGGRWFVSSSDSFFDFWYDESIDKEDAELSLAKYLTDTFNADESGYLVSYLSEPSNLASPSNVPFFAWLAEAAEDSIGKIGEEEYDMYCADCNNGVSGFNFCVGGMGEPSFDICKVRENERHGNVNRCECLPGFMGPLCHIRPIEGTISLHLDNGSGVCRTCGEGNPWTTWDLDGQELTCSSPFKKLVFNDGNTTITRQFGLHLNATHFSVFVSSNNGSNTTDLCTAKEGTEEVYRLPRDASDELISVEIAIHLGINGEAEVVDPEEVECKSWSEVDYNVCAGPDLTKVYSTPDNKSMLQNAWLLLELKVTPNLGHDDAKDID